MSAKDWAWRAAVEEMGIHPAAWYEAGKPVYIQRTERMEGHNEAVMGITKRAVEIMERYATEAEYEAAQPREEE